MRIQITNSLSQIDRVHTSFSNFSKESVKDPSIIQKLNIVIDEVLSNIINYGFTDENEHRIDIYAYTDSTKIVFEFEDDGIGFNPLLVDLPDVSSSLETRVDGGLGIHLMKSLVDDIKYQRINGKNLLTVTKYVR